MAILLYQKSGNLYELGMPFWECSVKSLNFAIEKISKDNPKLDMNKVILIGHSNGDNIGMRFANKYQNKVKKIISLDSLRYLSNGNNILLLRANDTSVDNRVFAKNTHAKIIQMNNAKHINMYSSGLDNIKAKITGYINDFLQQ